MHVLLSCLVLSNCTSAQLNSADLDAALANRPFAEEGSSIISSFRGLCLSGELLPEGWEVSSFSNGWTKATDKVLDEAGLSPIKKIVLEIPGGGGRFDEEQRLISKSHDQEAMIGNLERRYIGTQTLSSSCSVYGKVEHLKTCETIGRLLDKAPDPNQRYAHNNSHFIRWETRIDGRPATISCDYVPESQSLTYDGTVLSLVIDHTQKAKQVFTANRPVAGVSER